jgi:hypothetical protein
MPGAPIRDVPKAQVGRVVQAFVDNGESRVEAIEQSSGLFTVIPGGSKALNFAEGDSPLTARTTRTKKKTSRKKKPA